MIDVKALMSECAIMGIACDEKLAIELDLYADLLIEWNGKMNLTAIKQPQEIVTKHFVDSLMLLREIEVPKGAAMIDVGTGAGFPSVPVKAARPDIVLTLLDSLNKRLVFLAELSKRLGQDNVFVHLRAEEAGSKSEYREKYDIATARAVAHLRELSEYCLPLVKKGGIFAAMKSGDIDTEIEEALKAIKLMGGAIEEVKRFDLPDKSQRSIICIRKISQTPTIYPRVHAKITKSPLV